MVELALYSVIFYDAPTRKPTFYIDKARRHLVSLCPSLTKTEPLKKKSKPSFKATPTLGMGILQNSVEVAAEVRFLVRHFTMN